MPFSFRLKSYLLSEIPYQCRYLETVIKSPFNLPTSELNRFFKFLTVRQRFRLLTRQLSSGPFPVFNIFFKLRTEEYFLLFSCFTKITIYLKGCIHAIRASCWELICNWLSALTHKSFTRSMNSRILTSILQVRPTVLDLMPDLALGCIKLNFL